jgi:lysine-ketoglutarate reductase/saccharopine dehydrogenase-like protein (TIGR00300 family)
MEATVVAEDIELEGHIIDSLILSKVLDEILASGGDFKIKEFRIGQDRHDRSHALIEVAAGDAERLAELIARLAKHGAIIRGAGDVELAPAERDGVFPERFYSTTNQRTLVRVGGKWHDVARQEMDCGIRAEPDGTFGCVPVADVRKGDRIVVGHRGVKVIPLERGQKVGVFEFMTSTVSTEKPKNVIIHDVAERLRDVRETGKKILLVGGPAIVHTGSVRHVVRLIEMGYIHILFAGNALATHDIEQALYGTSLGVYMDRAEPAEAGHEHHLRAINTVRRCGGIAAAVREGVIKSGIMHACITHGVDVVLAGSIRDDGPLPEVITDVLVAQAEMRKRVPAVGFALMIATGLHSIATGNLLPAWVPVVCVDISPSIVTKLADRGTFQTVGLVTDVEPFLRELLSELA